MIRNTRALFEAGWADGKFVCCGLDPEMEKIPPHLIGGTSPYEREKALWLFLKAIVDVTHDLVLAFKPNRAFFAQYDGEIGLKVLRGIVTYIHTVAPRVPVILDAKYGDIGNSAKGYAVEVFKVYQADAVTIHPYLGFGACLPFLADPNKMAFVLDKTSNEGSDEFQDLMMQIPVAEAEALIATNPVPWRGLPDGSRFTTLANYMAWRVSRHWSENGNCGLVTGATYPAELDVIRRIAPDVPLLIPGIGAQGGDHEATVRAAKSRFALSSSRGVIFASNGRDFAAAARTEVERLHKLNHQYLNA